MPNYAILRVTKLKGGDGAASDQHAERSRETPNADPDRLRLNRLLLGEDRELREIVAERVREHRASGGARTRSRSSSCC